MLLGWCQERGSIKRKLNKEKHKGLKGHKVFFEINKQNKDYEGFIIFSNIKNTKETYTTHRERSSTGDTKAFN